MDEREHRGNDAADREAPGTAAGWKSGLVKSLIGLAACVVRTLASFWAAGTGLVWGPGVPVLLAALAFGVSVVALVVFGSLIIMANLDAGMVGMEDLMRRQR